MRSRIVTVTFEIDTNKSIAELRRARVWTPIGGCQRNVERPKVNVITATKPKPSRSSKAKRGCR